MRDHRPRVERAIRFIADNLDRPLSLSEVARAAHLSEYHFHRIFAAVTGEPVGRFITRRRLELAALRVAYEPERSITEIALGVGYSSPSNFAKAFHAHFGCAPSRLREPKPELPPALGRLTSRYHKAFDPRELYALPPEASPAEIARELAELRADLRFEEINTTPLACLASPRGYDEAALMATWSALIERVMSLGLSGESVDAWGIAYDSPTLTSPELCRYHAAVPIPPGTRLDAPLFEGALPAGRYAVFRYAGPVSGVEARYRSIYSTWLPRSGLSAGDFVAVDHYVNDWPVGGQVDMEMWIAVRSP